MFIALRDIAFAKGRFLLMTTVIVMVAIMMVMLTGLSSGLVDRNISGIRALPVTHMAFEFDDKPTWSNSMVERSMWEGWAAQPGVKSATPPLQYHVQCTHFKRGACDDCVMGYGAGLLY